MIPRQMQYKSTVTMTTKLTGPNKLVQHNPINITNNAELATTATTGNGSKTNPYIIENLLINSCIISKITRLKTGIDIYNTSAYFKIKNVKIDGCHTAISLWYVEHGSVEDSIVNNFSMGIWAEYSSELQFNNLTLTNNIGYGLFFHSVHNFTLQNSNIQSGLEGIKIEISYYGIFANNVIIRIKGAWA